MRILFVITGLGMGGAERQVVSLADYFASVGCEVRIIYLTGDSVVKPTNQLIELKNLNIKKSIFGFAFGLFDLVGEIKLFKPNIVHGHMFHANILTRIARLFTGGYRLISTAHSTNEGGQLRMFAYRITDRLASISTNVSFEAVATFQKKKAVPVGRMIPVLNGIDTDEFKFSIESRARLRTELRVKDKKVILAVGRLTEAKDYPNLINAFSSVIRLHPDASLIIVGEGPLQAFLQSIVVEKNLTLDVIFLGARYDISAIMCAADVFVLSSAWEGFGLVVAEAMATERVVVATDCGGVSEVVGKAGILVPPMSSQKLASALDTALSLSAASAAELGSLARERVVSNYSLKNIVSIWMRIYDGQF